MSLPDRKTNSTMTYHFWRTLDDSINHIDHLSSPNKECPICKEEFSASSVCCTHTLCENTFHASCIDAWLGSSKTSTKLAACIICQSVIQEDRSLEREYDFLLRFWQNFGKRGQDLERYPPWGELEEEIDFYGLQGTRDFRYESSQHLHEENVDILTKDPHLGARDIEYVRSRITGKDSWKEGWRLRYIYSPNGQVVIKCFEIEKTTYWYGLTRQDEVCLVYHVGETGGVFPSFRPTLPFRVDNAATKWTTDDKVTVRDGSGRPLILPNLHRLLKVPKSS